MEMMSKILKDELMNSDIDEEGLRKLFQEGDTDNSGFLSIEEIYGLFRKLDTGGNYDLKLEEMV
jgi:Ca2+-binding EF-hand superfamily protein